MNKIGTLMAAGLITLGTSCTTSKNITKATMQSAPKTAHVMTDISPKMDTLVKPKIGNICAQVKAFRASIIPDSIKSGETFTLIAASNGAKLYTDPKFKTSTYALQEGLKTTFKTCPERTAPMKKIQVKPDTLVKQTIGNICAQVRAFRASIIPDSIKSGNTFTLIASDKGAKLYTDPKFKTPTYALQDSLKTTFKTCPDKAPSTRGFEVKSTSGEAAPKKVVIAAKNEFPASYPVEQERIVRKGETIYGMAKELSTVNGKKPSKALTAKVTKQILEMNNIKPEEAKKLQAGAIIKLPTGKSIIKK